MNIYQVKQFYKDKKDTPCPLTERLIKAGYQQVGGGYIDFAKKQGKTVDYRIAEPNQYWHLFESYLPTVDEDKTFSKSIVCGELIFWMAEVAEAVSEDDLEDLLDEIVESSDISNRKKWNKKIQEICFDKIVEKVEQYFS